MTVIGIVEFYIKSNRLISIIYTILIIVYTFVFIFRFLPTTHWRHINKKYYHYVFEIECGCYKLES